MSVARENLVDAAKASPVVGYAYSHWFLGINWGAIGSFLMAIYAVLLIMDKLGLLAPVKAYFADKFHRPVRSFGRHREDE